MNHKTGGGGGGGWQPLLQLCIYIVHLKSAMCTCVYVDYYILVQVAHEPIIALPRTNANRRTRQPASSRPSKFPSPPPPPPKRVVLRDARAVVHQITGTHVHSTRLIPHRHNRKKNTPLTYTHTRAHVCDTSASSAQAHARARASRIRLQSQFKLNIT